MTYHELIKKLLEEQEKIAPAVQKLAENGMLPEQLISSFRAVQDWSKHADIKLGENEVEKDAPNIDPPLVFSNFLHLYQGMFDKQTKSHIELYNEYAENLFGMVKKGDK